MKKPRGCLDEPGLDEAGLDGDRTRASTSSKRACDGLERSTSRATEADEAPPLGGTQRLLEPWSRPSLCRIGWTDWRDQSGGESALGHLAVSYPRLRNPLGRA